MEEGELTSSTKGIPLRELPHPRQQLREATTEERHADDCVGLGDAPRLGVEEGEDEGGGCEGEEASVVFKGGARCYVTSEEGEGGQGRKVGRWEETRGTGVGRWGGPWSVWGSVGLWGDVTYSGAGLAIAGGAYPLPDARLSICCGRALFFSMSLLLLL